ncbi:DUF1232 domain-containing protein [Rhodocytophaga rosea]|uniref:DUF1232 domain-containing protein n=1 Tax=Rhodocytophaga rosea TaxID=2704465 RepID=A0A6C0GGY5_9BACT|nr:YkvA family protein [Rhodocytophaga rosea]QHT67301.1 DUF1232 domain-containing protein [Rhodocytophaga rosea]
MKWAEKLKQKARAMKVESYALAIAYKDARTPWYAKTLIVVTLGYLLSPIDLIPDFIPVLGYIDDLIIVPALIALSLKLLPQQVLHDSREQAKQHISTKKGKAWWFAIAIILFWLFIAFLFLRHFNAVRVFQP